MKRRKNVDQEDFTIPEVVRWGLRVGPTPQPEVRRRRVAVRCGPTLWLDCGLSRTGRSVPSQLTCLNKITPPLHHYTISTQQPATKTRHVSQVSKHVISQANIYVKLSVDLTRRALVRELQFYRATTSRSRLAPPRPKVN